MSIDFESLYKTLEVENTAPDRFKEKSGWEGDSRFYKISKDEKGNGSVVVRFLPSYNINKTSLLTHVLKKFHRLENEKLFPGKDKPERRWKPEFMCPKTISKDHHCPSCDYGWEMYRDSKDAGDAEEKYKSYLKFTSKEKILTNILVIKDERRPENNGKVFLFELSKSVYAMFAKEVQKVAEMESEDKKMCGVPESFKAFDPYNIMCSRNMVLKYLNKKEVKTPSDYWGGSYFSQSFTAIAPSLAEAQQIVDQTYCLDEELSESKLISSAEIKANLDYVLFVDAKPRKESQPTQQVNNVSEDIPASSAVDMNDFLLNKPQVTVEATVEVPQPTQPEPKPQPVQPQPKPEPATPVKTMSDEDFLASLGM